jgi:hypothetical protein
MSRALGPRAAAAPGGAATGWIVLGCCWGLVGLTGGDLGGSTARGVGDGRGNATVRDEIRRGCPGRPHRSGVAAHPRRRSR